jgi:adenylate cyclase
MAKKSGKSKSRIPVAIAIAIGAAFGLLGLAKAFDVLELRLYDFFLGLKNPVKQDSTIVLLDVDEGSINYAGSWPWPRGLMARGLETLAEYGASYAVFDIEYINRSPMSVDKNYLEDGLKAEFNGTFDEIGSGVGDLFSALSSGNIKLRDAREYGNQLIDLIQQDNRGLYDKTKKVAIENDSYLGRAMRLFGSAYVTVNKQDEEMNAVPAEQRRATEERFSYPKVTVRSPVQFTGKDYLEPLPEISSMAAGAGFTNAEPDKDGIRRRINLVLEVKGKRYLQLSLAPLAHYLGDPEVVVNRSSILLKGAVLDGKRTDISIPVDSKGQMLIRWPKNKNYTDEDFFRHVPFYRLLKQRDNEDMLVANLRGLRALEAWGLVAGANPVDSCLAAWNAAEAAREKALETGSAEDRTAWLAAKKDFGAAVAEFTSARWDAQISGLLAKARAKAPAAEAPLYDDLAGRFGAFYEHCEEGQKAIEAEAAALSKELAGAFCIIGWTATATTDMGATPFSSSFVNVGTHAAVANTILQRDFVSDAPSWLGAILSLILSVGVVLLISRLKTLYQIVVGLGSTLAVFAGSYLVFNASGLHVPTLGPTLATFVSFLSYTLISFFVSEREKSFLRKAFGTYLSGDVINQIIENPDMLRLGGQRRWMTAMFTDVRGFSTISEQLDPEQLVSLLNFYLSDMSDLILQNHGTIDKYEGDAIISFYGAPLDYEKHARAACEAAVLMKKKEAELNDRFIRDGLSPSPLLTRIGLNTGDMVVGNMGTERKMDYTIMGNAVNLAARLEGVNKQYGSWILASDATKEEAGESFVFRRFDRVRVVGIKTPVQLWEVFGFSAETDEATLDFLSRFESAHQVYDGQDWKKAAAHFEALTSERPDDGPSAAYLKRAQGFVAKAPPAGWDGVLNLSEK